MTLALAFLRISPTLNALKQHIKRSAFQAIKRSQCLIKNSSPRLADHGVGKQQSRDILLF